jgi:hypothetical protein
MMVMIAATVSPTVVSIATVSIAPPAISPHPRSHVTNIRIGDDHARSVILRNDDARSDHDRSGNSDADVYPRFSFWRVQASRSANQASEHESCSNSHDHLQFLPTVCKTLRETLR